jgi:hypothetical protein
MRHELFANTSAQVTAAGTAPRLPPLRAFLILIPWRRLRSMFPEDSAPPELASASLSPDVRAQIAAGQL